MISCTSFWLIIIAMFCETFLSMIDNHFTAKTISDNSSYLAQLLNTGTVSSVMARPTPLDAERFLPHACDQLQAPFALHVALADQEKYVSTLDDKQKKISKGKSTNMQQISQTQFDSQDRETDSGSPMAATLVDTDEIVVTAVRDAGCQLVELAFNKCPHLPRLLLKVIGICVPYQPALTKLTIRWVHLEGEAIYEISKFIPVSQLSDISLDDSPVAERNYYLLLEHAQLHSLSLARCGIHDGDCAIIASKLVHPLPAARGLRVLSLASNSISDVGARALGEALRSNRSLLHLNLSGNQISDTGAGHILRSLTEFFLTYSELVTKRQRLMDYLKLRREVFDKCVTELTTAVKEKSRDELSRSSKRKPASAARSRKTSAVGFGGRPSTFDTLTMKADAMTDELIGAYSDPFGIDEIESRDKCVYSVGNMTLCYLNLSYNNLTHASVATVHRVLQYQSELTLPSRPGLLRIVIEGNRLPVQCEEYAPIEELIAKTVALRTFRPTKKMERGKSKVFK